MSAASSTGVAGAAFQCDEDERGWGNLARQEGRMEGRKKEWGRASEQESGVVPVSTASWARAEKGGHSRAVARGGMTGGPAWRLDARGGGAFDVWADTAEKVVAGLSDGWAARGRSRAVRRSRAKAGEGEVVGWATGWPKPREGKKIKVFSFSISFHFLLFYFVLNSDSSTIYHCQKSIASICINKSKT